MIITARAWFFLSLVFFPFMLNCMEEQSQFSDRFSTMSSDIVQYFMVEHLTSLNNMSCLGLTSQRYHATMEGLPEYVRMAKKATHKKRKLLLLNHLMTEKDLGLDSLLGPCVTLIAQNAKNKRDFWRNTSKHIHHVAWNRESTACIFDIGHPDRYWNVQGFLCAHISNDNQVGFKQRQLWVQLPFVPESNRLFLSPTLIRMVLFLGAVR